MNILTFDIEDWYNHDDYSEDFEWDKFEVRLYEGVDKILQALSDSKTKGTFMCLGWVAEKHPSIIKQIVAEDHHIGCHSYQHQLATKFTREEFKQDTYKAKCLIEDVAGCEVNAYRVPSFSITKENKWTFDVLIELGFKYDSSVFPLTHEFGGIPGFKATPSLIKTSNGVLKEFPISLGKILGRDIVFSGGCYFRIMPYGIISNLTRKSDYLMSYFHPSDFDPLQPQMPQLSRMRQFKNRVALKGAYTKFVKYIKDFNFINLCETDNLVDWSSSQTVTLDDI